EQTGTTPLQWLHRARVRRAQHLLETTDHPVERIAGQVGFGSPTAFRDRFKRTTGVSPHTYRRTFGSPPPQSQTNYLIAATGRASRRAVR
ncbi:helix-turn-helix domain-containing protein, partial [Streptomyces sp. NPDC059853]|uniref:helix-turn-helix domain-containing protein n=1 Tax=Streptomyces sp. NPDC059853 TaxID=3346973 RepID=UPI00365A9F20